MELVPTCLAFAAATVFRRLPTGRGIDRVADFLRAGGGGLNVELGFQPGLFHQVLHHELSHVAAADKEDSIIIHTLRSRIFVSIVHFQPKSRGAFPWAEDVTRSAGFSLLHPIGTLPKYIIWSCTLIDPQEIGMIRKKSCKNRLSLAWLGANSFLGAKTS